VAIEDNGAEFVHTEDGHHAVLRYAVKRGNLVLEHTEVPPELGGRGIGSALVEAAVRRARADGLGLIAVCPFASAWLQRHPDRVRGLRVRHSAPTEGS
jgi:predicted GNAT family acetyltransferase